MSFQGSSLPIQGKDLSPTFSHLSQNQQLQHIGSQRPRGMRRSWSTAAALMLPEHQITIDADKANASVNDIVVQWCFVFS